MTQSSSARRPFDALLLGVMAVAVATPVIPVVQEMFPEGPVQVSNVVGGLVLCTFMLGLSGLVLRVARDAYRGFPRG